MESWEKDFNKEFVISGCNLNQITLGEIKHFIKNLLKKERSRDKLQELIDFMKESKSNTDILVQYIFNNTSLCVNFMPSNEILNELGIKPYNKEAIILCILEKYFKEYNKIQTSDNLGDVKQAKEIFLKLTDDQRMEVLSDYCIHCGCYDSNITMGCQCCNDE